jgi:hypothetical protein
MLDVLELPPDISAMTTSRRISWRSSARNCHATEDRRMTGTFRDDGQFFHEEERRHVAGKPADDISRKAFRPVRATTSRPCRSTVYLAMAATPGMKPSADGQAEALNRRSRGFDHYLRLIQYMPPVAKTAPWTSSFDELFRKARWPDIN